MGGCRFHECVPETRLGGADVESVTSTDSKCLTVVWLRFSPHQSAVGGW